MKNVNFNPLKLELDEITNLIHLLDNIPSKKKYGIILKNKIPKSNTNNYREFLKLLIPLVKKMRTNKKPLQYV